MSFINREKQQRDNNRQLSLPRIQPLFLLFIAPLLFTVTYQFQQSDGAEGGLANRLNATELEGRLQLPTFTYERSDYEVKEAAYLHGVQVRNDEDNQLKLPEFNIEARLEEERRKQWYIYRMNPIFLQQKRLQLTREYERKIGQLRLDHVQKTTRLCYDVCNEYINETFERPDLTRNDQDSSRYLMQLEMSPFPAKYLTMDLEAIEQVTHENCEQWEADYQCLFGCTADANLIDRIKQKLSGDFHLTANVECPNPGFSQFLPCVGAKVDEWLSPCSDKLKSYQQIKSQVLGRILLLENQAKAQLAKKLTRAQYSQIVPYIMQIQTEQAKVCAAYGNLLLCSLNRLKGTCSERAATFVHTSLVHNFIQSVLQGKSLVKQLYGDLGSVCRQLSNKQTFGLFPIKK